MNAGRVSGASTHQTGKGTGTFRRRQAPTPGRPADPAWTPADDAELDVLVWALVDGYFTHRQQCARCADGYPPCPHVSQAINEILDWQHARQLLTRAQHLRAQAAA